MNLSPLIFGGIMIQIRKPLAKNLYYAGITVYLLPNKMRLGNAWLQPYAISILRNNADFESILNEFRVYNCTNETGTDIHYYIQDMTAFNIIAVDGTIMKSITSGNIPSLLSKELNSLAKKGIIIQKVAQNGSNVDVVVG